MLEALVNETNPLDNPAAYHAAAGNRCMSLKQLAAAGGRISRLRILAEVRPGTGYIYDISYAHGILPSDEIVRINNIPAGSGLLRNIKGDLIDWARGAGVFAKSIGLLDETNWSILR